MIPSRLHDVNQPEELKDNEEEKAQAGDQPLCINREDMLSLEYCLLKKFCPQGIYIVPHYDEDNNSEDSVWDGIIFVRNGPYKNGKFFFFVCFPKDYPQHFLRVQFHSTIQHPLINPQDGLLDLRVLFVISLSNRFQRRNQGVLINNPSHLFWKLFFLLSRFFLLRSIGEMFLLLILLWERNSKTIRKIF